MTNLRRVKIAALRSEPMAELAIIEKWAENLDEVTVSRWLVQEGDEVEAGDGLCEIITDKATFEYEVQSSGTVKAI
ncbi:MAG: lipoyl domain-containing protein, partial [Armatimonadota bacterium]